MSCGQAECEAPRWECFALGFFCAFSALDVHSHQTNDRNMNLSTFVPGPDGLLALLPVPIFLLLALALLPSRWANCHVVRLRGFVTWLVGAEFALAIGLLMDQWVVGAPRLNSLGRVLPGLDAYLDGVSSLMLALVSFVGLIVSRFSIRYLDAEPAQGRYFRWLGFTIGAVSLMVVAGHLLLFFSAWVLTSLGLHQLLLQYGDREAARRAAWTKFVISRLGDCFLMAAVVLTYQAWGTWSLPELFARIKELGDAGTGSTHQAVAWLLVLGAAVKSAQFPFHTWLPDTMETPTPVSAMMHAGIVNAGGYLIIRMSPLIALAPAALVTLAAIGAFTACFAGLVMMTQTSVKRTLAYSTIAQMGFMMLQCGVGAFSVAMLHIIAHSLYKAHAFLSSGSVVAEAAARTGAKQRTTSRFNATLFLAGAAVATFTTYFVVAQVLSGSIVEKPGGALLGFILCLALTTWGWRLTLSGDIRTIATGAVGIVALFAIYAAAHVGIHSLIHATVAEAALPVSIQWVFIGTAGAFCLLFALHAAILHRHSPSWLVALRVHALNGFYVQSIYERAFSRLARS